MTEQLEREKKIFGQYVLLIEPCQIKPKHTFFSLEKNQKLDLEKMTTLLAILGIPYTSSHELRLGMDETASYISINLSQDFIVGIQKWTYLCYPKEIFFKKLRKTDLPDIDPAIRKGKYALYVNSTVKRELRWYKDIFLFFLLINTSLFFTTQFLCINKRTKNWDIFAPHQIKDILLSYNLLTKHTIYFLCYNLLCAKYNWLCNLGLLERK